MTWAYFPPGRGGRLKRIEERVGRSKELRIGGDLTIIVSPEDRFEMLTAAIRGEDHPLLDAVRSGVGEQGRDELADLLTAFEGGDGPPSNDPNKPWIA